MLKVSPSFLLNLEVRPRRENKMEFNNQSKSLTLSNHTNIQVGIEQRNTAYSIAAKISKAPSTVFKRS